MAAIAGVAVAAAKTQPRKMAGWRRHGGGKPSEKWVVGRLLAKQTDGRKRRISKKGEISVKHR